MPYWVSWPWEPSVLRVAKPGMSYRGALGEAPSTSVQDARG